MSAGSPHTQTLTFLNLLLNVVVIGWVLFYTNSMEHRTTAAEVKIAILERACKP